MRGVCGYESGTVLRSGRCFIRSCLAALEILERLFLTLTKATANIKSSPAFLPQSRPRRLAWPRTSPFHGGNTGSNPVGDASTITNDYGVICNFYSPSTLRAVLCTPVLTPLF